MSKLAELYDRQGQSPWLDDRGHLTRRRPRLRRAVAAWVVAPSIASRGEDRPPGPASRLRQQHEQCAQRYGQTGHQQLDLGRRPRDGQALNGLSCFIGDRGSGGKPSRPGERLKERSPSSLQTGVPRRPTRRRAGVPLELAAFAEPFFRPAPLKHPEPPFFNATRIPCSSGHMLA